MPPLKYSFSHLSESFLQSKKTFVDFETRMPKKNKEARTPPINILHTHLSASFCFAKTCQSLQVMDDLQRFIPIQLFQLVLELSRKLHG